MPDAGVAYLTQPITIYEMTEQRRLAVLLLAACGAVVGHVVAYEFAGVALGSRHNYLSTTAQVLLPLGAVAALWLAYRASRRAGLTSQSVSWQHLALLQLGLFAAQETTESLVSTGTLAHLNPLVMAIGLVAQIAVAKVIHRALASAARVVQRLLATAPLVVPGVASLWVRHRRDVGPAETPALVTPSRGPPVLFVL